MSDGMRMKVFDFFICSLGFFVLLNIASWAVAAFAADTLLPDWRSFLFPAHFWFLPVGPQTTIPFICVYGWMLLARLTNDSVAARGFFMFFTVAITVAILLFVILTNQPITVLERILITRDIVLGFCAPVFLLAD